jgi:hypothetical protein
MELEAIQVTDRIEAIPRLAKRKAARPRQADLEKMTDRCSAASHC